MISFKKWLENIGGNTSLTASGKLDYDSGLHRPQGLAYKSPIVKDDKSALSRKIDKVFGKTKDEKNAKEPEEKNSVDPPGWDASN